MEKPEHKATLYLAVVAKCTCGWQSTARHGKDAEHNAIAEMRAHRAEHLAPPPTEPAQNAQSSQQEAVANG